MFSMIVHHVACDNWDPNKDDVAPKYQFKQGDECLDGKCVGCGDEIQIEVEVE